MLTGKIIAIIIAIVLATSTTVAVLVTIIVIAIQPWNVAQVKPTSTPADTGTPAATPDADAPASPVITQTPDITMTVTPEITDTPDITPTVVYGGKVTICHIPPGNPNAAHHITISRSAVKAHLGHGDTVDSCPNLIIDVIVLTGTVDYEAGIAIDLDGILVPGYRGGDSDDDDDDHGGGGGGRHGDHDRGHGNDSDHHDEDNPGRSGHK
jgi:hypothetical protein